jgi:hypothetical protein
MGHSHFLNLWLLVKVYWVETCGTAVFVVYVGVGATRAIIRIIRSDRTTHHASQLL